MWEWYNIPCIRYACRSASKSTRESARRTREVSLAGLKIRNVLKASIIPIAHTHTHSTARWWGDDATRLARDDVTFFACKPRVLFCNCVLHYTFTRDISSALEIVNHPIGIALIDTCFADQTISARMSTSWTTIRNVTTEQLGAGCWIGKPERRMQDTGTRAAIHHTRSQMYRYKFHIHVSNANEKKNLRRSKIYCFIYPLFIFVY